VGTSNRGVLPVEFRHRPLERQKVGDRVVETHGEDVAPLLPLPVNNRAGTTVSSSSEKRSARFRTSGSRVKWGA